MKSLIVATILVLSGCGSVSGQMFNDDAGTEPDSHVDSGTVDASSNSPDGDIDTDADTRCGNGVIEGDEVCDGTNLTGASCASQTGLPDGRLACLADCSGYDTSNCHRCGNGVVEGPEVCDDETIPTTCFAETGHTSGELICDPSCMSFDTALCHTCGNGIKEGDEICDDGNADPWDGCDADTACVITEFRVNNDTTGDQRYPSVAAARGPGAGHVVVVWLDAAAKRIDGKAYLVTGESRSFNVTTSVLPALSKPLSAPSVAAWASGFVVVWTEIIDTSPTITYVFARTYYLDGTPATDAFAVGPDIANFYGTDPTRDPKVSASVVTGDFVVTWIDFDNASHVYVRARRYALSGTPLGTAFEVAEVAGQDSGIAMAMGDIGNYLIAWRTSFYDVAHGSYEYDLWGRYYTSFDMAFPITLIDHTYYYEDMGMPSVSAMPTTYNFYVTYSVGDGYWNVKEAWFDGQDFISTGYVNVTLAPDVISINKAQRTFHTQHDWVYSWNEETVNGWRTKLRNTQGQFVPNLYNGSHDPESVVASGDSKYIVAWTSHDQDGDGTGVYAQRYIDHNTSDPDTVVGVGPW